MAENQELSEKMDTQEEPAKGISKKIPFLVLSILLLGLTLFIFTKANLHVSDIFDIQRYEYNLLKLVSPAFLLFTLSFGLALASAIKFGSGIKKINSVIPLFSSVILAAIASFFAPTYLPAFLGIALTTGAASIAATYSKSMILDNKTSWGIAKKALTVLVIAAFILTFLKVSYAKEQYVNVFLGRIGEMAKQTAASTAPATVRQYIDICAYSIEKAEINPDNLILTKDEMRSALQASRPDLLPDTQNTVADACQQLEAQQAILSANKLKFEIAKGIRATNVSQVINQTALNNSNTTDALKSQLNNIPQAKQIVTLLPLVAAFAVLSLLSVLNFFLTIIATLGVLFLNKIGLE